MTKKILFGMMAATMMFATSCQNEPEVVNNVDETAQVTFAVGTPEIATRAFSDGLTATVLQYAVYDAAGNELTDLTVTDAEIHGSTTVNLQLTTGNTYSVIFWAAAEDAPYSVDFGTKTMTVDYANAVSNDENRDAFYKYHTFTVTGSQTETIELKRPFAQLNIGTSDYAASTAAGYTPQYSYVKVPVSSELNLATGVVNTAAPVEFKMAAIPTTETFPVSGYDYMAMSYLLVPADKEVVDVEFGYSENNTTVEKTRIVGSVPVQRNYRTNIYGKLLTSDVDINVVIKPEYDKENGNDLTVEALYLAAAVGGKVTLTNDVELPKPLNVNASMIIDMNDKTMTGNVNVAEGVSLTVENGTISNTDDNVSGITSNGNLTLKDVEIESARHALRIESGKVIIYGGTYKVVPTSKKTLHALNVGDTGTVAEVIIKGGTFIGPKGTMADSGAAVAVKTGSSVEIEGGNFSGGKLNTISGDGTIVIKGGEFDQQPKAAYVADGYKAVLLDGLYYVLSEVVADAAVTAGVTTVTESTADVATALATNNGEATMFLWNDVAYIAKYGEVVITSSADEATTVRAVVEGASALTSATVSEGVEVVGNRTFRKCAELVTVALPNTLTEIGPAVFQSCTKLANVTIPASVTTIGEGAFAECVGLTSINIPAGVTRLEKDVLRNTGLVSIEIPASVNYIGTYAFRDCESLTEVKILSPEFTIESNSFTNTAAPVPTMTIYVVNNEMKAYLDSVLTNYDKSYITVSVM